MKMGIVFKRFTGLIITLAMLLSMMPAVFATSSTSFVDFPTGWSKVAMEAAVNNGLLVGYENNEVRPQANLTRAEMAAIIARSFGAKTKSDISAYSDVSQSDWYYDYIAKVVKMGAMQGVSATQMVPGAYITREEVFTAIARVLVLSSDNTAVLDKFPDKGQISSWAVNAMAALTERGYVNGDESGNSNPKAYITREEFAQFMHNAIRTYISKPGTYTNDMTGITVVRVGGVTLSGFTNTSDIVIGDGVFVGEVIISDVKIEGRLLVRGGTITLKNTTVGDRVVVNDVNGVVHFNNHRDEKVFEGLIENTVASFLPKGSSGGSGGSGSSSRAKVTVTFYNGYPANENNIIGDKVKVKKGDKVAAAKIPSIEREYYEDIDVEYSKYNYKHEIKPSFWYVNDSNELVPFDDTVVITEDTNVYLLNKALEFYFEVEGTTPLNLSAIAYYNDETRLMNSVKDMAISVKSQLDLANMDSKYNEITDEIIQKLVNKEIIDKDKNVKVRDIPIPISKLISKEIAEDMIRQYIRDVVANENELDKILSLIDVEEFADDLDINDIIAGKTADEIADLIKSPEYRNDIVDYILKDIKKTDSKMLNLILEDITKDPDFLNTLLASDVFHAYIVKQLRVPNDLAVEVKDLLSNKPKFKKYVLDVVRHNDEFLKLLKYHNELYNLVLNSMEWEKFVPDSDAENDLLRFVLGQGSVTGTYEFVDLDVVENMIKEKYDEINGLGKYELLDDDGKSAYKSVLYNEPTAKVELLTKIKNEFYDYKKDTLDKFANGKADEIKDETVNTIINDLLVGYVTDYIDGKALNADDTIHDAIEEAIEEILFKLIRDLIKGDNSELTELQSELQEMLLAINKVKDEFPVGEYLDSLNEEDIRDIILAFIEGVEGAFVEDNKTVITEALKGLDVTAFVDEETVKNYIKGLNEDKKKAFADEIFVALVNDDNYRKFMHSLMKEDYFEVNKSNCTLITAVSAAISGLTYESAMSNTDNASLNKIIDIVGEDFIKDNFITMRDNYCEGLDDVIEKVTDSSTPATYTTSLTLRVNLVEVCNNFYEKAQEIVKEKLEGANVYYDSNAYLQELVNHDILTYLFEYDSNTATEELTGYKLKSAVDYYDYMLMLLLVGDDALCWYGKANLSDADFEALYDAIFGKVVIAHEKMNELLEAYEADGTLPEHVQSIVDEVEQINNLIIKYGDDVKTTIRKYLNSSINIKFEDGSIDDDEKVIKIADWLVGKDKPVVNIDTLHALYYSYDDTLQDELQKLLDSGKIDDAIAEFESSSFGKLLSGKISSDELRELLVDFADKGLDGFIDEDYKNDITVIDAYEIKVGQVTFKFKRVYQ